MQAGLFYDIPAWKIWHDIKPVKTGLLHEAKYIQDIVKRTIYISGILYYFSECSSLSFYIRNGWLFMIPQTASITQFK